MAALLCLEHHRLTVVFGQALQLMEKDDFREIGINLGQKLKVTRARLLDQEIFESVSEQQRPTSQSKASAAQPAVIPPDAAAPPQQQADDSKTQARKSAAPSFGVSPREAYAREAAGQKPYVRPKAEPPPDLD